MHGKRVMQLVRELVMTCRVRASTLFPEIWGGSQIIIPIMICDRKQNQAMGKTVFLRADIHYFRALKLGLFPLCPFSKPFGCKIFLMSLRGGWNI